MTRIHRSEAGLTLVEVVITVVIMTMIIGALAASFVTALDSSQPNADRIRESNDAQVIASFLVRDAQSAGGTDPATGTLNQGIGVSKSDAAGCAPDASLKLRFSWIDHVTTTTSHTHVANYFYDSPGHSQELVRTTCTDGGSPTSIELGRDIGSVATICNPDCDAAHPLPDTVSMTITGAPRPTAPRPYSYTLTASLRPENQTPPDSGNSVPVPLLVLGGLGCIGNTTGFDVGGNASVSIYGQVDIDTTDLPGCPAMFKHGSVDYISGSISILKGGTCTGCAAGSTSTYSTPIGDPYASIYGPLAALCTGGSNPAPGPGGYQPPSPGQPLVFPNLLNAGNAAFAAGTYVFCNGVNAGTITTPAPPSPEANFYVVNGGMSLNAGADVSVNGLVYAPTSIVGAHGHVAFQATAIAVGGFVVQGQDPVIVLGNKPATSIDITSPASLPSWTVNRQYPDTTITATGGGGFYSWSATGLPAGLSITGNGNSAVISGTPTTAGGTTVIVSVVDQLGDLTSKTYPVTIGTAPAITAPATLTDWTINRDYPGTAIIASGGTTPYAWSATGLPNGLSINAATGVVSGTPNATNTYTPTITLTDATGATATTNYTIKINAAPSITGPASIPNWTVSKKYPDQTMTATNGTTPYTWAASGLPTGLTINAGSGLISGTPTSAGTFSASVTMTDKAGASATKNYSVTINPAPGIATASLPNAEVGKAYNFTLTPTPGGTPPYTWAITAGPAWLSINANTGALTGTPPGPPSAPNVTVQVTDSTGASASKTYTLTVAAAVQISGPASLPNWTINRDYPGTAIIVAGGVAPFTWLATGLPNGLSINAGTGVITGTPTATGTFTVTVTVQDAYGVTDPQTYTVKINASPSITTGSLPAGNQGVPYSTTLAAANGTLPYTWAASGLPPGLAMNPATGVLSGTPKPGGTFSVTITVSDLAGASSSTIFNLDLTPAPPGSITSVTLANTGSTAGRILQGDTITVVFSTQMSVSSFCSTWSNDANNQNLTANGDVVITVTDGTGVTNDSLTVTSNTCTFNFGSLDLGSNAYVTGGAATFSGNGGNASKINWTAGSNTLTITLGTKHGAGAMATVASSAPTYTAGPITTSLGGTLSNSPFALGNGQQF